MWRCTQRAEKQITWKGGKQDAYGFSLTDCSVSYGLLRCSPHHLTVTNQKRQPHRKGILTEPGKLLHLPVFHRKTKIVESNPGG